MENNPNIDGFLRKALFVVLVISMALTISAYTQDVPTGDKLYPDVECEETCTYDGIVELWCDEPCGIHRYYGVIRIKCCDPCNGCHYNYTLVCANDYWGYCN